MFINPHARHNPDFNPFDMDPTPGPGEVNIYDSLGRLSTIVPGEDALVYEFTDILAAWIGDRPIKPIPLAASVDLLLEWLENGDVKADISAYVARKWKGKESYQELVRERLPDIVEAICPKDFFDEVRPRLGV